MKYRLTFPVRQCAGFQSFIVDADSPQQAKERHDAGLSEFEDEEVEVMHLGEPDVSEISHDKK